MFSAGPNIFSWWGFIEWDIAGTLVIGPTDPPAVNVTGPDPDQVCVRVTTPNGEVCEFCEMYTLADYSEECLCEDISAAITVLPWMAVIGTLN